MFSIESLIEIQIVGILLLIAISPLLNLLSPSLREQKGFCPFIENIPDKSAKAIIILIMAFIIGVAGNRLIDDFIADVLYLEGREQHKKDESDFKKWAVQNKKLEIKLAEYYVSDNSQTAKNYFERHKILMRILRGAAFASFLMLLSMLIYQISLSSKKLALCSRYSSSHFIIVVALLAIFSFTYKLESEHYYDRVAELYMNFDKIKPPENKE